MIKYRSAVDIIDFYFDDKKIGFIRTEHFISIYEVGILALQKKSIHNSSILLIRGSPLKSLLILV